MGDLGALGGGEGWERRLVVVGSSLLAGFCAMDAVRFARTAAGTLG